MRPSRSRMMRNKIETIARISLLICSLTPVVVRFGAILGRCVAALSLSHTSLSCWHYSSRTGIHPMVHVSFWCSHSASLSRSGSTISFSSSLALSFYPDDTAVNTLQQASAKHRLKQEQKGRPHRSCSLKSSRLWFCSSTSAHTHVFIDMKSNCFTLVRRERE